MKQICQIIAIVDKIVESCSGKELEKRETCCRGTIPGKELEEFAQGKDAE
jgi:hypothetical protein